MRELVISCETNEQATDVTRELLRIGYIHGSSGWSKKIEQGKYKDFIWTQVFTDSWNEIEYCNHDDNAISYDDFMAMYSKKAQPLSFDGLF